MRTKTMARHGVGAVLGIALKRIARSKSVAEKCLAGCFLLLIVAASAENLTLTMAACALMAAAAKHLNKVERK